MSAQSGVLQQGATEERGENARMASFIGAVAIADLVKSTLGPKGMDKILQSMGRGQAVTITNDGATILKSIYVDNPAAKVLVDISKVQDDEVRFDSSGAALVGRLLPPIALCVAATIMFIFCIFFRLRIALLPDVTSPMHAEEALQATRLKRPGLYART